jgi:hypothetical protein
VNWLNAKYWWFNESDDFLLGPEALARGKSIEPLKLRGGDGTLVPTIFSG